MSFFLINLYIQCNDIKLQSGFFEGTLQADYKIHLKKKVYENYQGIKKRTISRNLVYQIGTHTVMKTWK